MVREVKFRAWDKEMRMMHLQENGDFEFFENGFVFCPTNGRVYGALGSIGGNLLNLMQFTGLRDKNDKEIYEGDIIYDDEEDCYGLVIFRYGCFRVDWYGISGTFTENGWDENSGSFDIVETETFDVMNVEYLEIIGNIYENPELLKNG